ncbi:hypothetical protein SYNPS1DRAFT_28235 [Syncephalis pseudoplumigaleata]|uniref:DRBM domain-containing protein n=1 Tax=Syncephalis pseudoplumigaleata TaxID=1712513 RepID=A0A4P9Z182_9FUNG|nr:hypothetical protein SYNPS1DRAFT_28235 [Syncephalis pseudoplumigaleata]|eukprot:RKP26055.1 hypothetical protein SYNPS1DRAFT_28235 [Syncephalis pseudoplumigaleata]
MTIAILLLLLLLPLTVRTVDANNATRAPLPSIMHPVSRLQEYCQAHRLRPPTYTFEEERANVFTDPAHVFSCCVCVDGFGEFDTFRPPSNVAGFGRYPSKRAAKDAAAELAWQCIAASRVRPEYQQCRCRQLPDLLRSSEIRTGIATGSSYMQALNMLCTFFGWALADFECTNLERRPSHDHVPQFEACLTLDPSRERLFFRSSRTHPRKQAAREDVARAATLSLLQRIPCTCGQMSAGNPGIIGTAAAAVAKTAPRGGMHDPHVLPAMLATGMPADVKSMFASSSTMSKEKRPYDDPMDDVPTPTTASLFAVSPFQSPRSTVSFAAQSSSSSSSSSEPSSHASFTFTAATSASAEPSSIADPLPPTRYHELQDNAGVRFYCRYIPGGVQCKVVLAGYKQKRPTTRMR